MYIEITINTAEWSVQLKQEDGTNIGAATVYNNTDYALQRNQFIQSYVIQEAARTDQAWPIVAAYPFSRTIVRPPIL